MQNLLNQIKIQPVIVEAQTKKYKNTIPIEEYGINLNKEEKNIFFYNGKFVDISDIFTGATLKELMSMRGNMNEFIKRLPSINRTDVVFFQRVVDALAILKEETFWKRYLEVITKNADQLSPIYKEAVEILSNDYQIHVDIGKEFINEPIKNTDTIIELPVKETQSLEKLNFIPIMNEKTQFNFAKDKVKNSEINCISWILKNNLKCQNLLKEMNQLKKRNAPVEYLRQIEKELQKLINSSKRNEDDPHFINLLDEYKMSLENYKKIISSYQKKEEHFPKYKEASEQEHNIRAAR